MNEMYEVKTHAFNCLGNGNKGDSLTDQFLRQQYVYMSTSTRVYVKEVAIMERKINEIKIGDKFSKRIFPVDNYYAYRYISISIYIGISV